MSQRTIFWAQEHLCGPISHLTKLHVLVQASQGSSNLAINERIMLQIVIFLNSVLTTNKVEKFLTSEIIVMVIAIKYKIYFL